MKLDARIRLACAVASIVAISAIQPLNAQNAPQVVMNLPGDTLDVQVEFQVTLVNGNSLQPLDIWHHECRQGYRCLSFEFVNQRTGKRHLVQRKEINDDQEWQERKEDMYPRGGERVWLPTDDSHVIPVGLFAQYLTRYQDWTNLPTPNSPDEFQMTAIYESVDVGNDPGDMVWSGKIRSNPLVVKLTASELVTVNDYLECGFVNRVLAMLEADPDLAKSVDEHNIAILHQACELGDFQVAKWLLEHGIHVDMPTAEGATPLHFIRDLQTTSLVLARQPDLNIACERDFLPWPETPLQRVTREMSEAKTKKKRERWSSLAKALLAAGAELDLRSAIHLGNLHRVKEILRSSPERAHKLQHDYSTLRTAVELGQLEISRYLIDEFDVDRNDADYGGYPIIASSVDHPDLLKLLIESSADFLKPLKWKGKRTGTSLLGDGTTLLHLAAKWGVPDSITLLIDKGLDPFALVEDTSGDGKRTALEIAIYHGNTERGLAILTHPRFRNADESIRLPVVNRCLLATVEWSHGKPDRVKLAQALIDNGADPNYQNGLVLRRAALRKMPDDIPGKQLVETLRKNGAQPDLITAIAIGDGSVVADLLPHSFQAETITPGGSPGLHIAILMNHPPIVRQLILAGWNYQLTRNSNSQTPLHHAAELGRSEIVRFLLDEGAELHARNQFGETPLHRAIKMGQAEACRILLAARADPLLKDHQGQTPVQMARQHPNLGKLFVNVENSDDQD